jgi:hypothetical protein
MKSSYCTKQYVANRLFVDPAWAITLFCEFDHHIRNLHVLFGLILGGHLEDDVLLVFWNWLFADVLHKLAHTASFVVSSLLDHVVI